MERLHLAAVCSAVKRWLCSEVVLVALLITAVLPLSSAQEGDECPANWYELDDRCYRFVHASTTVQRARIECQQDWATLVSVTNTRQHNFLQARLEAKTAAEQEWFTSGYRASDGTLRWSSDGSEITTDFFPSRAVRDARQEAAGLSIDLNRIVYHYDASNHSFVWGWSRIMAPGGFICQIDKSDTWKIYQQRRDFSYGTGITDPNQWRTGPNITFQSPNTLFFHTGSIMTPVVLDCQASGNPRPTYKWFRQAVGAKDRQEVTSALGSKYVITNGRLTISKPDEDNDASFYTCEASNEIGTVQSNPIEVSYGSLGEFSNDGVSATPAKMYMGVEISCQSIASKTDLAYNWFKGTIRSFIRPELNAQYFLSKNGKLYISEVQASDQATYHCIALMVPKQGQVLATNQAPSRISMPIRVQVSGENANTYGPDIQDKFPQVFPTVPMAGERMEIECLAFGRLPLYYSWRREDGPLNPHATFADHNRRLIIPKARLEDTGVYTCMVRGASNSAEKSTYIILRARPSFPYPLRNQHLDKGSAFTWRCNAVGVPVPTYTWFKNGQRLSSSAQDGLTVKGNTLTITSVDSQHEGMYQCEARNSIGMARSSAQLRALSIAPTFEASPVESSKQAAEGGDVIIACRPHAAPRASIRWEKNGAEVGPVLANGDLHLTDLKQSDAGTYTCVATNDLGDARSSCVLNVQAMSVFDERPEDRVILVNESTTFPCRASFDRSKTDIVYTWSFNNHVIDFTGRSDDSVHYGMPYAETREDGILYVTSASFEHEGLYTCRVSSVTGSITAEGFLTVQGPPGEPGGVHARNTGGGGDSFQGELELWWQKGRRHGFDVTFYIIEYRSVYDGEDEWNVLVDDLTDADTAMDNYPDWQGYWVKGQLSPGTSYNFRVRSCNAQVGCSSPSAGPYAYYRMTSAPPIVAPENVGGGGGAVGLLQMTWDPLPRSKWGGEKMSYILYFKKHDDDSLNAQWQVKPTTKPFFYTVVGEANYYLPYDVKVQAKNEKGEGPNSTVVIVYSAELLPEQQPTDIQCNAINGTAGIVEWTGVPNTREAAHGQIGGYQINYWDEGDTLCDGKFEGDAQSINVYGDVTEGVLIGMIPGGDYCVNIQLYNVAGLGPKTDNVYLGMNDWPPSRYPEYVTVMSSGEESVRLLWDGVTNDFGEEPIRGYRAWWWEITEDIRSARNEDFGKTFTGVIHGVERDTIYRLRMMAYSNGGDGAKSPEVFFTLGGQVRYDPLTMEIMNSSPPCWVSHRALSVLPAVVILLWARIVNV